MSAAPESPSPHVPCMASPAASPLLNNTASEDDLERPSKRPRINNSPTHQVDNGIQPQPPREEEEKRESAFVRTADGEIHSSAGRASDDSTDDDNSHAEIDMTCASSSPTLACDPVPTAAEVSSKKSFPCRTCGALLSSASNRSRHERTTHGASKKPPTQFVTIPAIPPTLPRRSRKRTTTGHVRNGLPRHSQERSAPMIDTLDDEPDWDESDHTHEPDDVELQQYLAATILDRANDSMDGEEAKSSSSNEDRASSNGSSDVDSAASSDSPAISMEDEPILGMPTLLSEAELQSGCFAFLQWLATPPLTPCEALVKVKRVKSLTQLKPVKGNLRFIFTLLNAKGLTNGKADLNVLARLDVCQALFDMLSERGVGSGRYHAVFLLLKKVLTYLATQESSKKKQFLLPTIYDSYMCVDGICSDSGQQRKQEAQNRALLGAHVSQQLQRQRQQLQAGQRPQPFAIPSLWSSSPSASGGLGSAVPMNVPPSVAAIVSSNAVSSPNEMTKDELKRVTQFCLVQLQECMKLAPTRDPTTQGARDRWFQALLVTGTLCMGLAPRSQVLAQMRIGSTFVKEAESGRYLIRLLGDQNKHGKPTLVPLPLQLTSSFDHYLDEVRPRLLARRDKNSSEAAPSHDYVFFRRNGSAPRSEYGCTSIVTQTVLSRRINPHAFRCGVVTMFHSDASHAEVENLARVMAHSSSVARSHYNRPVFAEAAVETNDKMMRALLAQD